MTQQDDSPTPANQAAKWQAFNQAIAEARAGFAGMRDDVLEALAAEATAAVRDEAARQRQR